MVLLDGDGTADVLAVVRLEKLTDFLRSKDARERSRRVPRSSSLK